MLLEFQQIPKRQSLRDPKLEFSGTMNKILSLGEKRSLETAWVHGPKWFTSPAFYKRGLSARIYSSEYKWSLSKTPRMVQELRFGVLSLIVRSFQHRFSRISVADEASCFSKPFATVTPQWVSPPLQMLIMYGSMSNAYMWELIMGKLKMFHFDKILL